MKRTNVLKIVLVIVQINEYNKNDVRRYGMDYLTTIEMAEKWGISARRVATLCEKERVDGVIKKGKTWLIPSDSVKPEDARKRNHNEEVLLNAER